MRTLVVRSPGVARGRILARLWAVRARMMDTSRPQCIRYERRASHSALSLQLALIAPALHSSELVFDTGTARSMLITAHPRELSLILW